MNDGNQEISVGFDQRTIQTQKLFQLQILSEVSNDCISDQK